ncbi:hypothetical protein [Phaffia rhodozyma]|uniref:Uncharacterized protein n=1 Tax=Phaffia rhodozyma TaxID=264483 RepID=A0A0F7SP11_PHARH|nr:hypothetical protein [Phaffia rhodozyma]
MSPRPAAPVVVGFPSSTSISVQPETAGDQTVLSTPATSAVSSFILTTTSVPMHLSSRGHPTASSSSSDQKGRSLPFDLKQRRHDPPLRQLKSNETFFRGRSSVHALSVEHEIGGRATSTGPVAAGYPDCSDVGNDQLTCFPTNSTVVIQNEWSKLIWNFNYPLFIASSNLVDVYLFLASSDTLIRSWTSLSNEEGQLAFSPSDAWWEDQYGASVLPSSTGTRSWQAYFVIVPGGDQLTGAEVHQATFIARQTAIPTVASQSLASQSSTASIASQSSLSVASIATLTSTSISTTLSSVSRASVSSLSTLSVSSLLSLAQANPSSSASILAGSGLGGSLQGSSSGLAIPKWAIVLVSVLSALVLIAALIIAYLIVRRLRTRTPMLAGFTHRRQSPKGGASVNSNAPIMREQDARSNDLGSLQLASAEAGALAAGTVSTVSNRGDDSMLAPTSPTFTYSNQSMDREGHLPLSSPITTTPFRPLVTSPGQQRSVVASPFSTEDANSISNAYREALTHPTFFSDSERDSPPMDDEFQVESLGGSGAEEVLRRELAREGTIVRNVQGGGGGAGQRIT